MDSLLFALPEHTEGATKGLKVTKSLSSSRSQQLTYLDYMNNKSHSNTFKHLSTCGEAANRFPEQRPSKLLWQLGYNIYDDVDMLII